MIKKPSVFLSVLMILILGLSAITGCSAGKSTVPPSGSSTPAASPDIVPITAEYAADDLDSSWSTSAGTQINLNNTAITVSGSGASASGSTLTIKNAGTYVLTGTLTDGQILIDAGKEDTVRLVLNGATITAANKAPVYSKQAKKTIITLAEGTVNTVSDNAYDVNATGEDEPNAAVYSIDDLTINGSGALIVNGNANNGIGTKDNLIITGGTITVTSANDGLRGRDSIAIKDGIFNISAGGDGLQANNDEDTSKGWISLDSGDFTIKAGQDALQAETMLQTGNPKLSLTTGDGSANASTNNQGEAQPG